MAFGTTPRDNATTSSRILLSHACVRNSHLMHQHKKENEKSTGGVRAFALPFRPNPPPPTPTTRFALPHYIQKKTALRTTTKKNSRTARKHPPKQENAPKKRETHTPKTQNTHNQTAKTHPQLQKTPPTTKFRASSCARKLIQVKNGGKGNKTSVCK